MKNILISWFLSDIIVLAEIQNSVNIRQAKRLREF